MIRLDVSQVIVKKHSKGEHCKNDVQNSYYGYVVNVAILAFYLVFLVMKQPLKSVVLILEVIILVVQNFKVCIDCTKEVVINP